MCRREPSTRMPARRTTRRNRWLTTPGGSDRLYLRTLSWKAANHASTVSAACSCDPGSWILVHTRGLEYRADMICREPMKLFEEEEPSFF